MTGRRARTERAAASDSSWACPTCRRRFTRRNQRHACGTGDRAEVLRNRPPDVVAVFDALEAFVTALGGVEVVARERYVLFRTRRIFADLVVRPSAVRLVVHLARAARHPLFSKVVADRRHVSHVATLRRLADVRALQPFLREAHAASLGGGSGGP